MNVKAIRKQLLAAIAMVIVAAIALSSSTYAWFVNNTTVTAEGMTVQATTDASLLISDSASGTFASIANQSVSSASMKPCTSYDGGTMAILDTSKTKVLSAAAFNATMNDGSELTADGLKTESTNTGNTYWIEDKFYLKYNGSTTTKIYVPTITVTKTAENTATYMKSIRVAVKIGDSGTWYAFNPQSGTAATVGKYDSTWSLATPSYATGATEVATAMSNNTAVPVYVRVWFEGQDSTCYTDAVDATGFKVSVDFSTVAGS